MSEPVKRFQERLFGAIFKEKEPKVIYGLMLAEEMRKRGNCIFQWNSIGRERAIKIFLRHPFRRERGDGLYELLLKCRGLVNVCCRHYV